MAILHGSLKQQSNGRIPEMDNGAHKIYGDICVNDIIVYQR